MSAIAAAAALALAAQARAGLHWSWDDPNEVNPANQPTGVSEPLRYRWGDSYDSSNKVGHTQSSLYPTDGTSTMRVDAPLNAYVTGLQVLYDSFGTAEQNAKFTDLTSSTKILLDVTTPGHGPGYQTLDMHLNFGGGPTGTDPYHYMGSYSGNNYGFVDSNPATSAANSPPARTEARTQTFTWDFGGEMMQIFGQLWPDLGGYTIIHIPTGNGNVNDPNVTATSQYFLDNFHTVNEDTSTRSTWQTVATGDWNNSSNWANGVPNAVGAPAIFYGNGAGTGTVAANANVTLNSAVTVGSIIFDSQMTSFQNAGASSQIPTVNELPQIVNYNISGTGTMTLNPGAGKTAEIYTIAGAQQINVPVVLTGNTAINTSAGFGPDNNPNLPGGGRHSNVARTSIRFGAPITTAAGSTLTTRGLGTVTFAAIRGDGNLTINGGYARVTPNGGNTGTSHVAALSIAPAATLDLNDNDLIVTSGTYAAVTAQIARARNGGAWDRPGLTSSSAGTATPKNKTLGTVTGAEFHTAQGAAAAFDGFAVANTDLLVKYTYYGDSDLNGQVNFDDYSRIDAGFNNARTGWFNGDFDYSGGVDFDDYSLIDNAFNTQSGTLRRAMSYLDGGDRSDQGMNTPALQLVMDHFARFGQPYANGFLNAVPEPASASIVALAALTSLRRRRRQACRAAMR